MKTLQMRLMVHGISCLDGLFECEKMIEILIKCYIVVPAVLLVVTLVLIVNGNNKVNKYNECSGTIVRFYENTSELRVGAYEAKAVSPVVSYSVNGNTYEFIANYYSTSMKVGQEVKVLYSKEDNTKATIKTGIYFAPIITGGLTLLFVLPIVMYAVLKSKGII